MTRDAATKGGCSASRRKWLCYSVVLILVALGFPIAAWLGGQAWLAHIHQTDPTPNQNAMVLALLALIACCVVSLVLIVFAIGLLIKAFDNEA